MDEALDRPLPPALPGGEPYYVPLPLPPRNRVWLHALLLVLTFATTTIVGGCHYLVFSQDFESQSVEPTRGSEEVVAPGGVRAFLRGLAADFVLLFTLLGQLLSDPMFSLRGLWYSLTVLAILGCHEMGHYLACRFYRVDASLPYFLPAPLPLTGTLGAFIRIRQRIPSKRALFDIGIAGPIAGFLVAVPALFLGLAMSRVVPAPADLGPGTIYLGEPLLFRGAAWLIIGDLPDGYLLNMHPVAFAAWFGLLATALNLFPIGQLDGGHISYAVLGRRSTFVTLTMMLVAIGLTFVSQSWMVWTILLIVMLLAIGPQHPPTLDDSEPIDRPRVFLALIALVMLIVCFTPAPIEPFVTGEP